MSLAIQLLSQECKKENFSSGYDLLDNYLHKQAKQDVSRNLSACYVLVNADKVVLGYYTLSSSSQSRENFPEDLIKKMPRSYDSLPTILLGRLAVDKSQKGQRYGELLLINALQRCSKISESLGTLAITVDPIDENAASFFYKYGFIPLDSGKMFITIKTIRDLFA